MLEPIGGQSAETDAATSAGGGDSTSLCVETAGDGDQEEDSSGTEAKETNGESEGTDGMGEKMPGVTLVRDDVDLQPSAVSSRMFCCIL